VHYRFCSDEQADLNPGCYRYDSGADAYESVQSVIDSYWNYYIFTNYRRERLGFSAGSTADRILGRYFEKLQRANQTYALYRGVFQDAWSDVPGIDAFMTAERGFGTYSLAVGAAYQTLTRVITAPEPGGYSQGTRGDGTLAMMSGGNTERVNGFDGRYLETTWDFDAGYFWFDQLDRVGYFYDKKYALLTLVDPTTYFVGRDTDADIRKYQLSYAASFGPAMTALFRSVLAEDWQSIAPRPQGTDKLAYPTIDQMMNGNMGQTPIIPNVSFSIQLYAALWGMGYIPQTYDQSFIQSSRLWIEGGAEEVVLDPSVPVVTFTDPDSNLTYTAISFVDGSGKEQGVAASMINYANDIFARVDPDGVPASGDEDAAALQAGRKYVDNLDLVRSLTWELGFGAQP
jgi:hypothetical protein